MQNGYSLRAVVDKCGIPLTTLRNYRKRGIISPDVADKSGKLTLYSDSQIEIAKAYRSEHSPKNDKNLDAEADNSTPVTSKSAGKKAYIVNPPESLGVKFNRLNVYLGDNGAFEVDAHFDTTNIETAYRRFVDFFLQAATDIPALNGYDHFPSAKKLIQNVNGWENEFGDQIFFPDASECLCVDINEDFIYIFGKFNQHSTAPVAEPQHEFIELEPASVIDTESLITESLENKTLDELADEANHYVAQGDACFKQGLNFYFAAGRRLIEAKSRLPHGQWQPWLNDNFFASADTAENYMKLARRFGAKSEAIRFLGYTQLIQLLALPEGDEEDFIAAQAAAGRPVEKQSAREIQRNVKAFKKQFATKKVPDDDKLPTFLVTTEPELADDLHDDLADVPTEETDDSPAIVDRDSDSNALPTTDLIPAPINPSTDVVTNLVDIPAQVTAVRELIVATINPQQLRAIRVSLKEILALLDDKLNEIEQEN